MLASWMMINSWICFNNSEVVQLFEENEAYRTLSDNFPLLSIKEYDSLETFL